MTIPFADYQAIEAVNWSSLKHMDTSPLHYRYQVENPREDTNRLLLGRAVHTAVLEPDEFPLQYVVWEGGVRRGKDYDAFCAANTDRGILKLDEYQQCLAVRDAVRSNPFAGILLDGGESEVTRTWTDPATGIECKCRIDHLSDAALTDLKTAATVDEHDFTNAAARYLYHGQLAFYRRAVGDVRPVYMIAVEIDPPHDVAIYELPEWVIEAGDALVDRCLARLAECRETGEWPGRYPQPREFSLPAWMQDEADTFGGLFGGGDNA